MPEQLKIITSRRAYEFGPEALRLSTISIQPIQQQIQRLFTFQSSVIGTPTQTFGMVPLTFPPGIAFVLGAWVHQEEHIVPIRFLNFEANRIVIDVAGPSSAIDGIVAHLFQFLSGLQAADGTPVVGEPERVLNYSEISAQFSFSLDVIFSKPLRRLLSKTMSINSGDKSQAMVPVLAIQMAPVDEAVPAVPSPNEPHAFTFTLRSGTRPDEHIYFSSAPLDSETHLNYLNEFEAVLTRSHST